MTMIDNAALASVAEQRQLYAKPREHPFWRPYGFWRTAHGEVVMFNRQLCPLFTRSKRGQVRRETQHRQVEGIRQSRPVYDDWTRPEINEGVRLICQGFTRLWWAAAESGKPVSLEQLGLWEWENLETPR